MNHRRIKDMDEATLKIVVLVILLVILIVVIPIVMGIKCYGWPKKEEPKEQVPQCPHPSIDNHRCTVCGAIICDHPSKFNCRCTVCGLEMHDFVEPDYWTAESQRGRGQSRNDNPYCRECGKGG